MLPQTDAELIAFNYGADWHAAACDPGSALEPGQRGERPLFTPVCAAAADTLGPDLFWMWADRGYYSHFTTSHQ